MDYWEEKAAQRRVVLSGPTSHTPRVVLRVLPGEDRAELGQAQSGRTWGPELLTVNNE